MPKKFPSSEKNLKFKSRLTRLIFFLTRLILCILYMDHSLKNVWTSNYSKVRLRVYDEKMGCSQWLHNHKSNHTIYSILGILCHTYTITIPKCKVYTRCSKTLQKLPYFWNTYTKPIFSFRATLLLFLLNTLLENDQRTY